MNILKTCIVSTFLGDNQEFKIKGQWQSELARSVWSADVSCLLYFSTVIAKKKLCRETVSLDTVWPTLYPRKSTSLPSAEGWNSSQYRRSGSVLIIRPKYTEMHLVWSDPHMAHDTCFYCSPVRMSRPSIAPSPLTSLLTAGTESSAAFRFGCPPRIGAPMLDRLRWLRAVNRLFKSGNRGFASWNSLMLNFTIGYFRQHNCIIKAWVKANATCFDLKSHPQAKLRTMKFFTMWLRAFGTQGQKPAHHCMKKPVTVSHKKVIRRDATDPEQKAVRDYKEQVDRNTSPSPTLSTGKLINRRINTTTSNITTRSPISEQRPQEIAHVTYLTLISLQ